MLGDTYKGTRDAVHVLEIGREIGREAGEGSAWYGSATIRPQDTYGSREPWLNFVTKRNRRRQILYGD